VPLLTLVVPEFRAIFNPKLYEIVPHFDVVRFSAIRTSAYPVEENAYRYRSYQEQFDV
jgi:hypothetical protein